MPPEVHISRNRLTTNIKIVKRILDNLDIEIAAVTKVFCGNPAIAGLFVEQGINLLADSRLDNLVKLRDLPAKKMHLRLPMLSEVEGVVEFADVSLVSHKETAKRLSTSADKQGRVHRVILMVDLGDLREGILCQEQLLETARYILGLPHLVLEGIGTNLTCFGGVLPTAANMAKLHALKKILEARLKVQLQTVSGGNSSSLNVVQETAAAQFISQLRIGEAFVLGRETAHGNNLAGAHSDCFTLRAEIIEKNVKPSVPIGEIGIDGFGNRPRFPDRGERMRVICALGKQDVDFQQLVPQDSRLTIIGGSSDHLILDIHDCAEDYHLGGWVTFALRYSSIMQAMTSEYTRKLLVE